MLSAVESASEPIFQPPVQRAVAELRPDHGELAQRGVDDPPLEVPVPLQDEAEQRGQHQQQREEREEAVVGDRRRQVATLVVGVLQQHGEREAEPPVPLLEAIEGAVSLAESAHAGLSVEERARGSVPGERDVRWRRSTSSPAPPTRPSFRTPRARPR
jgi:hypothetical protein